MEALQLLLIEDLLTPAFIGLQIDLMIARRSL